MAKTIKGLDELLKELAALEKDIDDQIELILEDNALQIVARAKTLAPVDEGELRSKISAFKPEKLARTIQAAAAHSAYQEFGTGGLVEIPPELSELAAQFKGSGRRKIDMRPQPFLFPAFDAQKQKYLDDLRELLNKEI